MSTANLEAALRRPPAPMIWDGRRSSMRFDFVQPYPSLTFDPMILLAKIVCIVAPCIALLAWVTA